MPGAKGSLTYAASLPLSIHPSSGPHAAFLVVFHVVGEPLLRPFLRLEEGRQRSQGDRVQPRRCEQVDIQASVCQQRGELCCQALCCVHPRFLPTDPPHIACIMRSYPDVPWMIIAAFLTTFATTSDGCLTHLSPSFAGICTGAVCEPMRPQPRDSVSVGRIATCYLPDPHPEVLLLLICH